MKYKEFKESGNYTALAKIPRKEIKILWHTNWYDGYLAGICQYTDKKYYYKMFDEEFIEHGIADDDGEKDVTVIRKFLLIELDDKQISDEIYWHGQFKLYVNPDADNDYNNSGCSKRENFRPRSEFPKFYDNYKGYTLDLSDNNIFGRFEDL